MESSRILGVKTLPNNKLRERGTLAAAKCLHMASKTSLKLETCTKSDIPGKVRLAQAGGRTFDGGITPAANALL